MRRQHFTIPTVLWVRRHRSRVRLRLHILKQTRRLASRAKGPLHVVAVRQCLDCGHKQEVKSYVAERQADGDVSCYFGSAYDFCNECDGPMKTIDKWEVT